MKKAKQIEASTPYETGVVLLSFGKRGYKYAVANLAASIKFYSPDAHIIVITDDKNDLTRLIRERITFIDTIIQADLNASDPAINKLNLYNLCENLPFERFLYVDVDSICLKDITPILTSLNHDYCTIVNDTYLPGSSDKFSNMAWGTPDRVYKHFKLNDSDSFPSTNTSFQFWKKNEKAKKLFDTALEFYEKKFPATSRELWGKTHPDELYINAAIAKLGIDAGQVGILIAPYKTVTPVAELTNDYYFMTYFGGRSYVPLRYKEYYDRKLINIYKSFGYQHFFKLQSVYDTKHVQ